MAKTSNVGKDGEPLERAIVNCIETNAVMQLKLSSKYWCGHWENKNCPYLNLKRTHDGARDFNGCDYKRKLSD